MKAIIKRIIEAGKDPYFILYAGTTVVTVRHFRTDAPEGDIWNEDKNLAELKKLVPIIEGNKEARTEETIYETPSDDLPGSLYTKS